MNTFPVSPRMFTLGLLLGVASLAAPLVLAGNDPFGGPDAEPAVEAAPTEEGVEIEVEDADRVEVETTPDGVRVEVEEQIEPLPDYPTETVALEPRLAFSLDFPTARVDRLQSRIDHYGFIDNRHEWATLWVMCKGTEPLPKVDFTRELVVYYLNSLSGERLPAVAYVTDGNLSLSELHTRNQRFIPGGPLAPMHVQVVPRAGLVRLVVKTQSLLIPGGFLAVPGNPADPAVVPVPVPVPVPVEPLDDDTDDLFD